METGKARQAFDYRLVVMNGIEMGQAIQNKEKAQEILRRYRFDFVLGSLHCIRGMDDFAYIDFSDLDVDVILTRYFEEILELCQWGQFDSLAHLTYPLRYITGQYHIPVDLSRYDSIIDEILRTLAQKVWDWKSTPPDCAERSGRQLRPCRTSSSSASWAER